MEVNCEMHQKASKKKKIFLPEIIWGNIPIVIFPKLNGQQQAHRIPFAPLHSQSELEQGKFIHTLQGSGFYKYFTEIES